MVYRKYVTLIGQMFVHTDRCSIRNYTVWCCITYCKLTLHMKSNFEGKFLCKFDLPIPVVIKSFTAVCSFYLYNELSTASEQCLERLHVISGPWYRCLFITSQLCSLVFRSHMKIIMIKNLKLTQYTHLILPFCC
jgi:hypothetical protein